MTLPSDEWCRITHLFTGPGVPTGAAVVYAVHIDASQPVGETAQSAHDLFGVSLMPFITSDVTLVETIAKEGPDVSGASASISSPTYPGALSSTSTPPNGAVLITKLTVEGGRRGKGRMFMPCPGENDIDDGGVLGGAYLTALQSAADDWRDDLGVEGIPMALEHSPATEWILNSNGQPRRVPVAGAVPDPDPVLQLVVAARLATQRRRLRR